MQYKVHRHCVVLPLREVGKQGMELGWYNDRLQAAWNGVEFGNSEPYEENIEQMADMFLQVRQEKRLVYFIGNGGSAGIAIHMTSDFLKNGGMRTHSMHDPATLTCLANDLGYGQVFSKQLEFVAGAGDLLVAVSSSGESENILNAVQAAREIGCRILTLSGFRAENRLRKMGDINVYVPCMEYGIVESVHNAVLQQVVDEILVRGQGTL